MIVRDLAVQRGGRPVLHGVSFELRCGTVTALLGANGAGKSTLVMTIAGVLPAAGGRLELGGENLLGLPPDAVRRRGVTVVPEGHSVLPNLSVLDNLRAAGSQLGRAELEREIRSVVELFPEVGALLNLAAHNLSGGQKQMLAIGQALIGQPRFLLIDELSFGLAPVIVVRLGETIRSIAERGVGILLIEQFATLALSLASEAHVMERGRVVFSGTSAELSARPEVLHDAYLAAQSSPRAS
ncbi:MAG: ATP-binding cassette domain-containing protein [Alphaproteobacteria bacterium]|nr:ATP-binding cassette domain-containing protein [Alphaproteobacteria bacterium]